MKSKFPKIIAVTFEQQENPDDSFFTVHKQAADASVLGENIEVAIYVRQEVGTVTAQTRYTKKG